MRKGKSVIGALLLIVLGFIVIGVFLRPASKPPSTPATPGVPREPVMTEPQLVLNPGWAWKNEDYSRYIVGTVANKSPIACSYAQISFSLLDKDGNQVGTAWDNISDLEGWGTWSFKALVFEDEATRARFAELTGN